MNDDIRGDGLTDPSWRRQRRPRLAWSLALVASVALPGCSREEPQAQLASAKQYLAQKDSKSAYIQLKNVLQKSPDLAEARFLLGKLMFEGGDLASSVVELRKARELNHPADAVVPLLAKALLSTGQDKKLTDDFAAVVLTAPAAVADLQTSLAVAYTIQDRRDKADAALNAAFEAVPDHVPALIARARNLADRHDVAAAFKVLDTARAKAPDDHDVWQLQGDLLWTYQRDAAAAIEAYKRALVLRPDSLAAHTAIVEIDLARNDLDAAKTELAALRKVRSDHPRTKYLAARLALQQGDFKAADDIAVQLLKFAPDEAQFLQLAGILAAQKGTTLEAEQYLRKALQLSPDLVAARRLLARIYTESGQTESALSAALPLVERGGEPNAANALAVGLAYLQNGNLKKAEELFAVAHKLDPKDVKGRTALAAARLSAGGGDAAAIAELDSIAGSDGGVGADLTLIASHLARQDYASALKAVDRLERKQPDKPLAGNLRGRVLLIRRDTQGARRSFERALAIDPSFFPAIDTLVMLDLQEGKPEAAQRRLEAFVKGQPANAQGLLTLARLRAGAGTRPETVLGLIERAVAAEPAAAAPRVGLVEFHLERREFKSALDAATVASTALPNSPEVLDALARAQLAAGDVNQAVGTYGRLVASRPKSPQFHAALAGAYLAAKNNAAAMQSLRQALLLAPDYQPAQRQVIALLQGDGNHEAALEIARGVQKRRPDAAVGYLYEGDIEAFQKHWLAAAAAYRTALGKASDEGAAQRLHSVLTAGGKRAEADAMAAAWQSQHPQDAGFNFYLADLALAEHDYPSARKRFQRVVELEPANAEAHNNLAWVLGQLKGSGALEHAEIALRLRPGQPAFMDTLAGLLASDGNLGRAIELERNAVLAEPSHLGRRMVLAKYLVRNGDKVSARHELDAIVGAGETSLEAKEARQMLAAL